MLRALLLMWSGLFLGGCTNPSAEACRIAKEGPANALTASVTADQNAPDASAEATRHDVTLAAIPGGNGGSLRFNSEGGRHIFYTSTNIALTVTDDLGAQVSTAGIDEQECAEILASNDGTLPQGPLFINLGPSSDAAIALVVLAAAEDDDDSDSDSD